MKLQKWDVFRIKRDIQDEKVNQQRKKQWLVTNWVALLNGHSILTRIDKNILAIFDEKKKKAIRNAIARILQARWKSYLEKIAPSGPDGIYAI
jgi:hypothetical protein